MNEREKLVIAEPGPWQPTTDAEREAYARGYVAGRTEAVMRFLDQNAGVSGMLQARSYEDAGSARPGPPRPFDFYPGREADAMKLFSANRDAEMIRQGIRGWGVTRPVVVLPMDGRP